MVFALSTERLALEDLNDSDLDAVRRMARDPAIMKYVWIWLENEDQITGFVRHAIEEATLADWQGYILAARIPGTGDFAGFALLEIDPASRPPPRWGASCGRSTGRTAMPRRSSGRCSPSVLRPSACTGWYGKCDDLNTASAHALERGGLVYEGTLREHVWLRDHWRSTRYYGMLKEEYPGEEVRRNVIDGRLPGIFLKNPGNPVLCFRDIFRCNPVDHIGIHGKIVVDYLVSQPDNGFPRYFRMPVPDFIRNTGRSLADLFDIAFHRIDQLLPFCKFCVRNPGHVTLDLLHGCKHF